MKTVKLRTALIGLIIVAIAGYVAGIALAANAATASITANASDTLAAICARLAGVVVPPVVTPPVVPPVTPPVTPPVVPPTTGGISLSNVYITGYADGDNTPPGSPETYLNGISGTAKGDCTYNNPTTMAVGHVITNGKDVGDFAYGTKFYVPELQCYFSAQDTCGDGPTPQNQPCHSLKTADKGATLWLDAYVGPKGTASCEEAMTKLYSVVQNPVAGLPVKQGNICK
jgi:hypothetical protein